MGCADKKFTGNQIANIREPIVADNLSMLIIFVESSQTLWAHELSNLRIVWKSSQTFWH